eukprot:443770-Pelagomonas_calceolata.AAC.3
MRHSPHEELSEEKMRHSPHEQPSEENETQPSRTLQGLVAGNIGDAQDAVDDVNVGCVANLDL